MTRNDIQKILNENELSYDFSIEPDGTIMIVVEDGDWKHDHLFINRVMREHNFILVNEIPFGEDGESDCYSSEHYFDYIY